MNIKLTPWEKRNLGAISSVEFRVEQQENWEDIVFEIAEHQEAYQVLHISSGNTDVLLGAQKLGFQVIEMNIQLSCKLDGFQMPPIYKRFEPSLVYSLADQNEKEMIYKIIKEGKLFTTDKVSRDPKFGIDYSGTRYALWTKDIVEQGAELLCMKYKDRTIGFDVMIRRSNSVAEAFLGGLFPEYSSSSMGFALIYLITKHAAESGCKKIITGVSTNNIPILKLHELFGYTVEGMSYCLIKHM